MQPQLTPKTPKILHKVTSLPPKFFKKQLIRGPNITLKDVEKKRRSSSEDDAPPKKKIKGID